MNDADAAEIKARTKFETYVAGVFAESENHFKKRQARQTRRQSDWVRLKGTQLAVFLVLVVVVTVLTSVVTVGLLLGR
jgi:hypothetical protein